jgi:hypothetical protein
MRFAGTGWPRRAVAVAGAAVAVCIGGCSSGGSGGTLMVSVIQEGGPISPNGQTPRSPVDGATILVTGGTQTWTAHTGKSGSASITLPAGGYQVIDPECGQGPQTANIAVGQTANVTITCAVP